MTGNAWQEFVEHEPRGNAEQYYLRIPDVPVLLDRLRPVFLQRLTAAGIDRTGRDLVISTFGAHHRIPVLADGLGEVVTGGAVQSPGSVGAPGWRPTSWPPCCSARTAWRA